MQELFSSGRIVDLICAFMAVEVAVLVLYRARTGRGLSVRSVVGLMLPGLFLLLALRSALVGDTWPLVAAFLLASLVGHLVDLVSRMKLG